MGLGAQEPDREECPGNSERKEIAQTKELRHNIVAHTGNSLAHCVHTYSFPSLSTQSYDYVNFAFLPPSKNRSQRHCSIINDPGLERHLTLAPGNTLIRAFLVSMRRKQVCFKLKVWEMSTFYCLMFLFLSLSLLLKELQMSSFPSSPIDPFHSADVSCCFPY